MSSLLLSFLLQVPAGSPPAPAFHADLSESQESVLDSAWMEMAGGRDWRAVRLLREAFPDGPGVREELVLLFARAEAGWNNWREVRALLEGPIGRGEIESPEAWFLLGRALESLNDWEPSGAAYGEFLVKAQGEKSATYWETLARRGRINGRLGNYSQVVADMEELGLYDPTTSGWVALEVAERAAAGGWREETREILSLVADERVRHQGWDLPAMALLAAGDSMGAEAAYWSALPSLPSGSERVVAWDKVGILRMARGDTTGASGAFHQVLSLTSAGSAGLRAAESLLALGFDSVRVALAGSRAFGGAGRHREALEAYSAYEALLGDSMPHPVRLAITRSHLALGQALDALAVAVELGASTNPEVGAPALGLRIQALRQLGRGGEVRRVQDELVERFPQRPEAVEILFNRADALQSRGDREGAIRGYEATVGLASSQNLAGQARMRMGQLLLGMGREEVALEVYQAYLDEFPEGRRWDEAAFWAGRLLFSLDRAEEGEALLGRLMVTNPLSYYTVRAGELLGVPYDPPIPDGPTTLPVPGFLEEGMARFDRLLAAGLDEGAVWEANAVADRLRADQDQLRGQESLLRLAYELNSRGFTREGINLGWELRRNGRPWDRDLLAAIYPFPYQDIVVAEAQERGINPFTMAGLIRQESAFWAEARSRADARGLMQVLPSTGRELARAAGLEGFRPDDHLYEAQINIHLGMAFFSDMRRRFGNVLPIILSAYNAGPTRALRWREFPEVEDMPRFVERIPFVETRGYVKNVLANRAIYTWLYGP